MKADFDFLYEIQNCSAQKVVYRWSYFAAISRGLGDIHDFCEILNFDLTSEIFKVNANRAIRDGVKELKELPDKSGEFRGYGDWYHRQGNMTKPHTEYVKEIIEDSYNHMGRVEGVIRNTDKDGI